MSIPFSKFHPREVHFAAEVMQNKCAELSESNAFIADYLPHLQEQLTPLGAAISKSSLKELVTEGREHDSIFGDSFRNLRQLLAMKASMDMLGDEATASTELSKDIEDLGGAIETLSRAKQITSMNTLIELWSTPKKVAMIAHSGTTSLFEGTVEAHNALKAVEEQRAQVSVDRNEIPTEWVAGRTVSSILSIMHGHIVDYAKIEKEPYANIVAELTAEFASIVTQVRNRSTRKESDVVAE